MSIKKYSIDLSSASST